MQSGVGGAKILAACSPTVKLQNSAYHDERWVAGADESKGAGRTAKCDSDHIADSNPLPF